MFMKKLLGIASCVAVFGSCVAMEVELEKSSVDSSISSQSNRMVANPIPLIINAVAPNFLNNEFYANTFKAFEENATKLMKKCEEVMASSYEDAYVFNEEIRNDWKKRLFLLSKTIEALNNKSDLETLRSELEDATLEGPFVPSKIAMYGAQTEKQLYEIIDNFESQLRQAADLVGFVIAINKKSVNIADIPEICYAIERGIEVFISKEDDNSKAWDVRGVLVGIGNSCGYFDCAEVVNNWENREKMRDLLRRRNLYSIN